MEPVKQLRAGIGSGEDANLLEQCKQRACEVIEQEAEQMQALSQDIWSQPELAYKEHQAHDRLTQFFSSRAGWEVQPRYKLDTAFRADWGPQGDQAAYLHVGFLCEYDALPGLGHACGHNLIAEVGAAAALGLRGALENLQPPRAVKVTVLGTPAEEEGGGKVDLLHAGAFQGMNAVFMAHPGQDDAAYLPDVAVHDVTVKYYGKSSHAAAYPWEGVNALDAAILAYNNVSVLRQQMKPTWRVHGIIKNGGIKPNIIPSYAELEFYLRASSRKDLLVLQEKVYACFKSAAEATGCQVDLSSTGHDYDNVLPNKTLARAYQENGKKLGMQFTTNDMVLNSLSGSTDFGNVSFAVPGIHPYFYIGSEALNHTEQYTEASGSKDAQFYALRTAKALAMTALDIIFQPGLMESVYEDFKKMKRIEENGLNASENARVSSSGAGSASC
ncbi:xaa-Arg dipeptidase [Spea bombifrons]|uniref:xaa-Arg dipeptidase n=1 Tax=Spea bombifrons TaxID=233779 RepID=UPI002349AB7A|nr:xaa-Arg dipeptidase [Spea bombifrons]